MGHKVSPKIFRMGLSENWNSRWFNVGADYVQYLKQDTQIRSYLVKKMKDSALEKVEIERSHDNINVMLFSSKPGVIIGRGGAGVEEIKKYIQKKIIKDNKVKLQINIKEVSRPQLSASIVAQNIALELEKRVPYRRAMKRNMEAVTKAGAQGIKVICGGRLNGSEIARRETLLIGKIPLHTFRANIDYSIATAETTYGTIGVKVWIYKGEVFNKPQE